MSNAKRVVPVKRALPPKPSVVTRVKPVVSKKAPLPPPEEVSEEETPEESVRAPRKKPTITDHIGHYEQLFELLDAEIDRKSREKEKGTRSLRTIRKVLTQMRKEVPYVTKSREARKQSSTRKESTSGLMMKFSISKELATFLDIPTDTKLSRVDVTRAICVYSHLKENEKREEMLRWKYLNPGSKRDLQFPQDKKAIIPDKALSKLLRYDEYKKKIAAGLVTHNMKNKETGEKITVQVKTEALHYWAIQNLLSIHFFTEKIEDEDSTQ